MPVIVGIRWSEMIIATGRSFSAYPPSRANAGGADGMLTTW